MKRFIDISRPVDEGLVSWPGRPPPEIVWEKSLAGGDHTNASFWKMSAHTGTHMDAPLHFIEGGQSIDRVSPDVFIGKCVVVDLTLNDRSVMDEALAGRYRGEARLLLKTHHSDPVGGAQYRPHASLLTPGAADTLVAAGLVLLGTDRLSVDDSRGEDFAIHRLLLGGGCVILEGLNLAGVEPGRYGLNAAPLRLAGKEASLVRALLEIESERPYGD